MMDLKDDITTDEILAINVAGGDDSAFEELLRRYESKIINLIYRYLHNSIDAEDLAQEVFFNVWKHAKNFQGKSKFSTWLYRITVNSCLNYKKQKSLVLESLNETIQLPEKQMGVVLIEKEQRANLINQAIDKLPPNQKMALILSHYEGRSYTEISEIMSITISSVESLLFRAKQNLKKILLPLQKKGEL